MPPLKVHDVQVSYGKVRALRGVTLSVDEREIVSIVGANGAGKSTILKAVMGLVPITAGTVEFGDRRLDQLSPPRIVSAGVSLCPEGRRLFPEMSVEENLRMGGYQRARGHVARALGEVYAYFPVLAERRNQAGAGDSLADLVSAYAALAGAAGAAVAGTEPSDGEGHLRMICPPHSR